MIGAGTVLAGRYEIARHIASGGMGDVWQGQDQVLGRTVAVKLLRTPTGEPEFVERFRAEARTMATISHPGVVDVYDFGDDPAAGVYLVMKYIDGESLARTLEREGRLDAGTTMRLVAEAAEALHAAHDKGVMHRDVKPGNLLIRPDGTTVLTDFGIARAATATHRTSTGLLLGTASYIAPERAGGLPATAQSDLYSLGVVAYQCLAGRLPFEGESLLQIALRHANDEPPPLPPDVPPAAREVVARCLAKDPADRWPSGAALTAAARHAMAAAPTRAEAAPSAGSAPYAEAAPSAGSAPFAEAAPSAGSAPFAEAAPSAGSAPFAEAAPSAGSAPFAEAAPSAGSAPFAEAAPSAGSAPFAQAAPSAGPAPLADPVPPAGPGPKRGRRLLVAGAATVVVAVAVAAVVLLSSGPPPQATDQAAGVEPGGTDAAAVGGINGAPATSASPSPAASTPASRPPAAPTLPVSLRPAPAGAPAAPTTLTATPVGATTIRLQWTDNSANETGFSILNGAVSRNAAANATTYNWDGLAPDTYMCFKVRAFNAAGASAYYPTAQDAWTCATTLAGTGPTPPTNLSATPAGPTSIRLQWTDNSSDETGFTVINGSASRNTSPNATSYTWDGLSPGTYMCFKVRAFNPSGVSAYAPPSQDAWACTTTPAA
ncbi:protein kinase domain-containing protein [Dactylosporangium sp. CA-139066]|uniref:protein kinase domain-containing protein n=1 Tax=Dactylosporangium sp. CA-139066 TaxID=3239930 RepID=UPI003D915A8A